MMKKLLSLIAIAFFFSSLVFGQNGPKMTFEANEVDYGVILQGSNPLRVFNFKNTGNQPLIISHAHGSCGCTVPGYPKEPILPGESGKIEVRYDTNRIGVFQKTISVSTNEGKDSHNLIVKGTVNAKPTSEGVPGAKRGFGSKGTN